MAKVQDIAAFILDRLGPTDPMKLQKLVYYCQAWSLAWFGEPIFGGRIEAWKHGPVSPPLYDHHRGRREKMSLLEYNFGPTALLSSFTKACTGTVISIYGHKDSSQLREMTHKERPWKEARGPLAEDEPCSEEITHRMMREYYSPLTIETLCQAYSDGRVTIGEVAHILGLDRSDAVALMEKRGCCRSIDKIRLDNAERSKMLQKIEADRIRRGGKISSSDEDATRSVIATQRLEGVDARPWFKQRNSK